MYIFIVQRRNLNEKKNERIAAATKDKRIGGLEGLQSSSPAPPSEMGSIRDSIHSPAHRLLLLLCCLYCCCLLFFFLWVVSFFTFGCATSTSFLLYNPQVPNEKGNQKRTSSENNCTGKIQGDCGCSSSSYGLESLQVVKRTWPPLQRRPPRPTSRFSSSRSVQTNFLPFFTCVTPPRNYDAIQLGLRCSVISSSSLFLSPWYDVMTACIISFNHFLGGLTVYYTLSWDSQE
jgi:hypothetical protein